MSSEKNHLSEIHTEIRTDELIQCLPFISKYSEGEGGCGFDIGFM